MLTEHSRKAIATCSTLAIAAVLVMAPQAARAQTTQTGSFQATPNEGPGFTVSEDATNTFITILDNQVVIDWNTDGRAISSGGTVNFQPAGTTATFQNARVGDYAVLNRISTSTGLPIQFNGLVRSFYSGEPSVQGGTVFFSSPTGIVAGPTAVFNVGNLGLTSASVVVDPETGNWISNPTTDVDGFLTGGTVDFGQVTVAGSRVEIQPGATINADQPGRNAFVALVAPRVINNSAFNGTSGGIRVDGSAALVSADAATITFRPSGLFDVQVTSGTSASGTTLLNSGSITGPAGTAGAAHRIYMVAVPKNDAITMAIAAGSTLGFGIATSASFDGDAVILSAGYNVDQGQPASNPVNGAPANISIDDSATTPSNAGIAFTSNVFAKASNDILVDVQRQTSFAGNVDLIARQRAIVSVDRLAATAPSAGVLTVGGNLSLSTDRFEAITGAASDAGFARVSASDGGSIDVNGDLRVSSQAFIDNNNDGVVGARQLTPTTSTGGGVVTVQALNGSTINVDGDLDLNGDSFAFGTGEARGNNVLLQSAGGARGASTVTVAGAFTGSSDGFAGPGSLGSGHFVNVIANGGVMNLGSVELTATGTAGGESASGGSGRGGVVGLSVSGPAGRLNVAGDASLSADGNGEFNFEGNGGNGTGGTAQIVASFGGIATVGGVAQLSASGFGAPSFASGFAGGTGQGGIAQLLITSGGTMNLGEVDLNALGFGGNASGFGVNTGAGTGGTARALLFDETVNGNVIASAGTLNVAGNFNAIAQGSGGGVGCDGPCAGTGVDGAGTGGLARIGADAPNKTVIIGGNTFLQAAGLGGSASGTVAGAGNGGTAEIFANSSTFDFTGSVTLDATASGGSHLDGGVAGSANGGIARLATIGTATALSSVTVDGSVQLFARAFGGLSSLDGGTGGSATANLAEIDMADGSLTVGGALGLFASASGGFGPAVGGNAVGGTAQITTDTGGVVDVTGPLLVNASGEGGSGFAAGDGTGGTARLFTQPGSIIARAENSIFTDSEVSFAEVHYGTTVRADGIGGSGSNGGAGGDGFGGLAGIVADSSTDGPVSSISLRGASVSADGIGGGGSFGTDGSQVGANGGAGTGGSVAVLAGAGNGSLTATSIDASASGFGGAGGEGASGTFDPESGQFTSAGSAGGAGGAGTGGTLQIGIDSRPSDDDEVAANTGSASLGVVSAAASGTGGHGGGGGSGTAQGAGGAGGNADGGEAALLARGGPVTFTSATIEASGFGGAGGAGSTLGAGGSAVTGNAGVLVTSRQGLPAERGSLSGESLSVTTKAVGGAGSPAGAGTVDGGVYVDVENGDINLTDITLLNDADAPNLSAEADYLKVVNGTVNASNSFSFTTDAPLSVHLDNATVNTANLTLQAPDWVLLETAPAVAGTFNVTGETTLLSAADLVTFANFDVASDEVFDIAGEFRVGNYTSTGSLRVDASGPVSTGNLDVTNLDLISGGDIANGSITADGYADLEAIGSIVTGGINAGSYVDVSADSGSLLVDGNIVSGQGTVLEAATTLAVGNVTAGPQSGEPFSIALVAGDDLTAGNLRANFGGIGVISTSGSLDVGSISSRGNMLLLAQDSVSTGPLNAANGQIVIGNASLAALGGTLDDSFDPAPIFAPGSQITPVGGDIAIAGPVAAGAIRAHAAGTLMAGSVTTLGTTSLTGGAGLTVGAVSAGQAVVLAGGSGALAGSTVNAGGPALLIGNGGISFSDITAGANLTMIGRGGITAGAVSIGGNFAALSNGDVSLGSLRTGTAATNFAYIGGATPEATALAVPPGNAFNASALLGQEPVPTAGSIAIAGPVTTGSFVASAGTGLTVGTPGASGTATTGGAITAANYVDLRSGAGMQLGAINSGGSVELDSGGALVAGAIVAAQDIETVSVGSTTLGDLTGFDIDLDSGGLLTAGVLRAQDSVSIEASGNVTLGDVTASLGQEDDPELDVGILSRAGSVRVGNVSTLRDIGIVAGGGSIASGNLNARRDVLLLAATTVNTGAITAGPTGRVLIGNASLFEFAGEDDDGDVTVEPIFAAAPVRTGGSIGTGAVSAGSFTAASGGTLNTGAITAGSLNLDSAQALTVGNVLPTDITVPGSIVLNSDTAIAAGNLTAGDHVSLTALGSIVAGAITAGGDIDADAGGTLSTGALTAGGDIIGESGGSMTLDGNLSAGLDIELASGGALTAGMLRAGDEIGVEALGNIALGNVTASLGSTEEGSRRSVGIASTAGSVTVGDIATAQDIGILAGGGTIAAGNLSAGSDVLLLANNNVTTGGIAAGSGGRILIAEEALADLGGTFDEFNAEPIFAVTSPARLAGNVTIGGPVTGGRFTAAATGTFSAPTMTLAESINIDPELVQVLGPWTAPVIDIDAGRLEFGQAADAGLNASQSINLRALRSGQQAVLGGTERGQGFTLTQADFARIRTPNLTIRVDQQGVSSSAPDLLIRDLTLTGSAASNGLSQVTITTPGWARIAGDLLLAQAGAADMMTVRATQRLEIVLPEASVGITSGAAANGPLAGTLTLSSNNLVAGTLDLLQQAMADPQAAGLAEALRTPVSGTPNLEGYIRANGVNLVAGANILLQNSGTARDFAGVTVGGNGLIIGRLTPTSGSSSGGSTGGSSGGTGSTTGFSFVGMLMRPDEVLIFDFATTANSTITLRTYSYAGGTNAAGQVIPRGGFDPILALFDAAGMLIGQNDDGGSNVPADQGTGPRFDTFFQSSTLPAGNYKVSVSVFPNFAVGPNLSNGFQGNSASSFGDRTPNFAFDVLGATSATGPGAQQPDTPIPSGPLNVIGFGRRLNADGTVTTNNDFFATINFNRTGENPIQYTDLSQFNTCFVNTGCAVVPPPQEPQLPTPAQEVVASLATQFSLISEDVLSEEPFEVTDEQDDEAEADESSSPIAPPAPLIDTRPLNPDVDVTEPVSGSGNPALIGSAVTETATQETQP